MTTRRSSCGRSACRARSVCRAAVPCSAWPARAGAGPLCNPWPSLSARQRHGVRPRRGAHARAHRYQHRRAASMVGQPGSPAWPLWARCSARPALTPCSRAGRRADPAPAAFAGVIVGVVLNAVTRPRHPARAPTSCAACKPSCSTTRPYRLDERGCDGRLHCSPRSAMGHPKAGRALVLGESTPARSACRWRWLRPGYHRCLVLTGKVPPWRAD